PGVVIGDLELPSKLWRRGYVLSAILFALCVADLTVELVWVHFYNRKLFGPWPILAIFFGASLYVGGAIRRAILAPLAFLIPFGLLCTAATIMFGPSLEGAAAGLVFMMVFSLPSMIIAEVARRRFEKRSLRRIS